MIESLNFAMTFPPTKDLIINLFRAADGVERTEEELCEYTAMPGGKSSGKLKPHLDYAKAMGILEYTYEKKKFTINKTSLGEVLYEEDFSLDENLTLQLLNYNMSSNINGTLVWNLLTRKLLSFKPTSLNTIYNYFTAKYEKDEKSTKRIVGPYKSAQDAFFQDIDFIDGNDFEVKIKPIKIDKRYVYMYAYTLVQDWDILFPQQSEVSFEEIKSKIEWGQGFGWNEEETFKALQLCEEYGLIKINKQLVPMTIVKNTTKAEALDKMFNLL